MDESIRPALNAGDKIGKYVIQRQLGRGTVATVYLAEQQFTKRKVAVKLCDVQNGIFLALARKEAELLASLDHPYIIKLYDADEYQGYFYLVVDYIAGKSLADIVTSKDALPISVALKLMIDIADALTHVHNLGIVHGDITPTNIIISPNGVPILMDFVVTDALAGGEFQDALVGTPPCMSPETWQRMQETRSDFWSFGMTFYYLLNGQYPFGDASVPEIQAIVFSDAPFDLSPLEKTLPKPILRILERCLQKDITKRYQSAIDLRHDCEAALAYIELGLSTSTPKSAVAALRSGITIMLNVEYKEPHIAGQYREYKIEEELGQGSFSCVYRAMDVIGDKQVALKILRQERAHDEKVLARFRQEAGLLSRLDHPNIVKVYNYGQYGVDYFIVMEVLPGPTLKDATEKIGLFSPLEAAAILSQLLSGLEKLHAENVIHRDVKPENIKLQSRGLVVMDLGLAHIEASTHLTVSGEMVGTPRYMSPEQARGEQVTAQSDIYTAGVIFYELISGKIPHEAESLSSLIFKIALEESDPITIHRNDLSPLLVYFLNRMLSRDPTFRFSSAQVAHEELLISLGLQQDEIPVLYQKMFGRLGKPSV